MKRLLIGCCLLALSTPSARAADWPQWRGPDRTGYVPAGSPMPEKLPASPKVVWKIEAGFGLASPVVCGGKAFYLDTHENKEVVHGVDAGSGKELWQSELDEAHKDSQSAAGPRCTPTADGDLVFAQSCRGHLKCLSATDGKTVWEVDYVKDLDATFIGEKGKADGATRHGYNGSPLVDGDHLIALAGGKGACVVCFEKKTGKIVWKSQDDVPAYAPPIIATIHGKRQIVAFTCSGVIALDPADGKLLWRGPKMTTAFGRHVTTPIVLDDMVVVASHQIGLIGLKINKTADGFSAEQAWLSKDDAINFSSPVLVGQHLYGVGPNQNLICVEVKTGKRAWAEASFLSTGGGKAHAGLIVMGKNLLILTDGGQLVLAEANPKEYKEMGRIQVCGVNWCNPAYVDGRVFMRDAKEVRCVEIGK